MINYTIDTIGLVKYLENELPKNADKILKDAEAGKIKIILPEIVIGEFIYICLKGKIMFHATASELIEVVSSFYISNVFEVTSMHMADWDKFIESKIPELHDRMICAIARTRNSEALITKDEEIKKSNEIKTIWN